MRAALVNRAWSLAHWLTARRRPLLHDEDVRRYLYRDLTQRMGVRMTEWLRDRLRPSWLRVQAPDDAERD